MKFFTGRKIALFIAPTCVLAILLFCFSEISPTTRKNDIHPPKVIQDISTFKNRIYGKEKVDLPPPEILSGYGIRTYDWRGNQFVNRTINLSNNSSRVMISMINANDHNDIVGFMIFVDGKLHRFSVDADSEEHHIYKINMTKWSMVNLPVSFSIDELLTFNKHKVTFVMIYNLDKVPDDQHPVPFFIVYEEYELHNIEGIRTLDIQINGNIEKYRIPEIKDLFSNSVATAINIPYNIVGFFQPIIIEVQAKEQNYLLVESAANKGTYSTTIFLNNVPIVINGSSNILWKIDEGQMLRQRFPLDASIGRHQLYSITIPLDTENEHNRIYESEKIRILAH